MKLNEENQYLPRYRNISVSAYNEMYNDLGRKMEAQYCRWYGSAYNLSSSDVRQLMNDIMTGKTSFAKWKKEMADANIRANMGLGPNDPIPEWKSITSVNQLEKRMRKLLSSTTQSVLNSQEFKVMMHNIAEDFGVYCPL
jgi:hypothetical protein